MVAQRTSKKGLDVERLLKPISSMDPTGTFLLYEGTYDRIREARRADSPELPRDIWDHDLKVADWERVASLCVEALETRTKDVQIAAWLVEAITHLRGFAGLAEGLDLILALCTEYWDEIHPPLSEDGGFRAAPFHWLNEKFAPDVMGIPIAIPEGEPSEAVTWNDWKRAAWLENMRNRNRGDTEIEEQIEESITQEIFGKRVARTPRQHFETQKALLGRAVSALRRLEVLLDVRLGENSPSLVRLREHALTLHEWTDTILRTSPAQLESAPETFPEAAAAESTEGEAQPTASEAKASHRERMVAPEFRGRQDAYRRIEQAARYLQTIEPHSPAPYLILRAVSWGEKPLAELIVELRRNGLDLDSLSSLLGLNQEADM
jgi:type VI secretion system protein ImpA